MTAGVSLRVAVGAGLAVLGLAAVGNWLSPPWEPRELSSDLAYGPLPPAQGSAPEQISPAALSAGAIRSEDVSLPVREEVLGGTVFSPAEAGRHPAVVLVHGAGPGNRSRLVGLAESFARSGIVALAYDKRTVGYSAVTNRDFGLLADDALAAVRGLRQHDDVDPARVGLWGISEGGGWVAPIAASRAPDEVAFAVLVSAPMVTPKQQLTWGVETGLTRLDAPKGLRSAAAKALGAGGFDYTDYDPLPALEGVSQPVLAIYGTEDTAVPVVQSSRELAGALRRGGNRSIPENYSGPDTDARLEALGRVARDVDATPNQVVLSWMVGKTPPTIPLISASTPAQLEENIGALEVGLGEEHTRLLAEASG
jgi:dienelactone hydrolase